MGDNLSILLLAELDKATSTTNINNQIKQLSKGLAKLNIKVNFDDSLLKQLNSQIAEITKKVGQTGGVKVKVNADEVKNVSTGLDQAIKKIKSMKQEILSMTKTTGFNKLGEEIETYNIKVKQLDGSIKTLKLDSDGIELGSKTTVSLENLQARFKEISNLCAVLKNDSREVFKEGQYDQYVTQLDKIKNQLKDFQSGKLSITDENATREIQKQLNLVEERLNQKKNSLALDEQRAKIQARINSLMQQIQNTKATTTDSNQLAQLNQLENSLKNVKVSANDAKYQIDTIQNSLKQVGSSAKATAKEMKLAFDVEQFQKNMESRLQKLFDTGKIDTSQLENFKNKLKEIDPTSANAREEMIRLRNEITNVARNANTGATGIQKFVRNVLQLAGIGSVYMVMQKMVNVTKELTLNVMELDSAMISLQRVSSGTATTYEDFKNNMFGIADAVGSTATDMVRSAKEFAQLGYSLEEAGILAENASKLATAGEMSIDSATKNITASLTAFNMGIEESGRLIDVYNRIGNTMAITSEGIGVGLARSANALAQANNTLEESVALISATNKTLQNPEVAGRGWRTISMRIRGKFMLKYTEMCV